MIFLLCKPKKKTGRMVYLMCTLVRETKSKYQRGNLYLNHLVLSEFLAPPQFGIKILFGPLKASIILFTQNLTLV